MTAATWSSGRRGGKAFYGCANYPDCEFTARPPSPRPAPTAAPFLLEKKTKKEGKFVCNNEDRATRHKRAPCVTWHEGVITIAGRTSVTVYGAGLAGARRPGMAAHRRRPGVDLHEMRPVKTTAVHKTDNLAELVCSNILRGDTL